ncbi:hypothetical protein R6Z07M_003028 [Ovis aries]
MGSCLAKTACELVAQTGQVPCLLCCSLRILQALYSCGEKGVQSAHSSPASASAMAHGLPAMALSWGLHQELAEDATGGWVLVVGVCGIGYELLKNLLFTSFSHIDLIDLDTNY